MKRLYLPVFIVIILILGCCTDKDQDLDKDGVIDEIDNCPSTPYNMIVDTSGCTVKLSVKVYIDASASMKGFMFTGSQFNENVLALVNRIGIQEGSAKIQQAEYIVPGAVNSPIKGTQKFSSAYTSGALDGKDSPLVSLLDNITKFTNDNSVSLLVTDGVLSRSNEEVRITPNINIQQLDNMKIAVSGIFSTLFQKGYACYVLAAKSEFKGDYYSYNNDHANYDLKNRPYYLFIIGKNKAVDLFLEQILIPAKYHVDNSIIANAKPANILLNVPLIYSNTLKSGNWVYYEPPNQAIEIKKNIPLAFPFVFNFGNLITTDNVISQLFQIEPNPDKTELYSKLDFVNKYSQSPTEFNNATHILLAEYNVPPSGQITVEYKNPSWYNDWNIETDLNPNTIEGQTFGIKYLLGGIIDASKDYPTTFVDLPIK